MQPASSCFRPRRTLRGDKVSRNQTAIRRPDPVISGNQSAAIRRPDPVINGNQ